MNEELKKISTQIDNSLLVIRKEIEELEQLRIELLKSANGNREHK